MKTDKRIQGKEKSCREKIQITKGYLGDFGKLGFPYEECVASVERTKDGSRAYVSYALRNGSSQEELTTLLTFHYLTWNDTTWALSFLKQHLEEILSKPKIKKAFRGFYNSL